MERVRTRKLEFKDTCQPENRSFKNWQCKFMNVNNKIKSN